MSIDPGLVIGCLFAAALCGIVLWMLVHSIRRNMSYPWLSEKLNRAALEVEALKAWYRMYDSVTEDDRYSQAIAYLDNATTALNQCRYKDSGVEADRAYRLAQLVRASLPLATHPMPPVPPLNRLMDETGRVWMGQAA